MKEIGLTDPELTRRGSIDYEAFTAIVKRL
jgi:hypothetical protein